MTTATTAVFTQHGPKLLGQTVVLSGGIGVEPPTSPAGRQRHPHPANSERLKQAARELDAQRTAVFDANDPGSLQSFSTAGSDRATDQADRQEFGFVGYVEGIHPATRGRRAQRVLRRRRRAGAAHGERHRAPDAGGRRVLVSTQGIRGHGPDDPWPRI
jgi:hypothetical protein